MSSQPSTPANGDPSSSEPPRHPQTPPPHSQNVAPAERPSTTGPERLASRASVPSRPPTAGLFAPAEQHEEVGGELFRGRKRAAPKADLLNEKGMKERAEDWARPLQVKEPSPPPSRVVIRKPKRPYRKSFAPDQVKTASTMWGVFGVAPIPEHPAGHGGPGSQTSQDPHAPQGAPQPENAAKEAPRPEDAAKEAPRPEDAAKEAPRPEDAAKEAPRAGNSASGEHSHEPLVGTKYSMHAPANTRDSTSTSPASPTIPGAFSPAPLPQASSGSRPERPSHSPSNVTASRRLQPHQSPPPIHQPAPRAFAQFALPQPDPPQFALPQLNPPRFVFPPPGSPPTVIEHDSFPGVDGFGRGPSATLSSNGERKEGIFQYAPPGGGEHLPRQPDKQIPMEIEFPAPDRLPHPQGHPTHPQNHPARPQDYPQYPPHGAGDPFDRYAQQQPMNMDAQPPIPQQHEPVWQQPAASQGYGGSSGQYYHRQSRDPQGLASTSARQPSIPAQPGRDGAAHFPQYPPQSSDGENAYQRRYHPMDVEHMQKQPSAPPQFIGGGNAPLPPRATYPQRQRDPQPMNAEHPRQAQYFAQQGMATGAIPQNQPRPYEAARPYPIPGDAHHHPQPGRTTQTQMRGHPDAQSAASTHFPHPTETSGELSQEALEQLLQHLPPDIRRVVESSLAGVSSASHPESSRMGGASDPSFPRGNGRPDKGKQRAPPTSSPPEGSLTLHLLDQVQTFQEDLQTQNRAIETQSRTQQDLLRVVTRLDRKLDRLEKGNSSAAPAHPAPIPQPSAPRPSARASNSIASRALLAELEKNSHAQDIDVDMTAPTEPGAPGSSTPHQSTRPTGASAVKIRQTSAQEEEMMVNAMSEAERSNVSRTFTLRLQNAIRDHMLYLLGVTSLQEIATRCPSLTDEEMAKYKELTPAPVLNAQNFRIDFKRPWVECEFNREARSVFVDNFLECVSGGMYRSPPIPSRFFTPDQVKRTLDSHMPHARSVWKDGNVPPAVNQVAIRKTTKCINTRKRTLRFQRFRTVVVYELDDHLLLISMLAPRHMSGDECPTAQDALTNTWVIIEAEWQSEELKAFLRKLDTLYQVYRLKTGDSGVQDGPEGGTKGAAEGTTQSATGSTGRGRGPRTRIARPSSRVVDSTAPIGLWRNCYNPAWLEKKRPHFVKGLQIIDEDYDFSLDMTKLLGAEFKTASDTMDVEEDDNDDVEDESGADEEGQ